MRIKRKSNEVVQGRLGSGRMREEGWWGKRGKGGRGRRREKEGEGGRESSDSVWEVCKSV